MLVDKFGLCWCSAVTQPRFRSFVFDERCIFVHYGLPNTKNEENMHI